MMKKKRLIGITMIAMLFIICGAPLLAISVIVLPAVMISNPGTGGSVFNSAAGFYFVYFSISTSLLLSGFGLMTLERWGRSIAIAVLAILSLGALSIAIDAAIFNHIFTNYNHTLTEYRIFASLALTGGIFFLSLIYYLNRPKVKEQFEQKIIDEENVELNPNNPLICHHCNRDYNRTWKVCLKCGKSLVEK